MGRSTPWLPFFWVRVGIGLSGSKEDIFGPRNTDSGLGLWGILVPKFGPEPGPQIVFQIGSGSGDPWGWWNMTPIGSRSLPPVLFQQGPLHPSSSFFSLFPPGFTLRSSSPHSPLLLLEYSDKINIVCSCWTHIDLPFSCSVPYYSHFQDAGINTD